MTSFSAGYEPPGVYVSTKSTGSTGSVGIGDTVVCLVGRGIGYQTRTETISFANGDTVPLANLGINADPATVLVTTTGAAQTTYQMDTQSTPHDFSFAQTTESSPSQRSTSIVRTPSGTIPPGATVLVRYQYTNDAYHALNAFSTYASFSAVYGPSLDPVSGDIASPLSLGAQIAFQNGANLLYAVALDTSQGATLPDQFENAYALTVPNYDINIMVPLCEDAISSGATLAQIDKLASFLGLAYSQGFPRIGIVGPAAGYTGSTPDAVSVTTANSRIVFTWPQGFLFNNPVRTVNGTMTVDGFYAAAAAAGFLANNDPNQGLTQAALRSFTGIPVASLQASDITSKNTWSSSGVSVFEINRLGQIVCRHGVTTDVSNVGNREISIVRCQDALFVEIELTLQQSGLIGTPLTEDAPLMVKSLVSGALETALSGDTIQGYQDLVVGQEALPSGDPTVINVQFTYQPTYPLNYITVQFTLDLSTGNISTPISDTAGSGSSDSVLQAV